MLDPEATPIFENWNDKTRNAPCNPGVPIPENCKDIDPAIVDCVVEEVLAKEVDDLMVVVDVVVKSFK